MDLAYILNKRTAPTYECEVYTTLPESPIVTDNENGLRVGKWTDPEEQFTKALIKHFLAGTLQAPTGISLRAFLAHQLRCSSTRISTKFAADTVSGERIPKRLGQKRFFPVNTVDAAQRQRVSQELYQLEIAFLDRDNIDIRTAFHGVSADIASDDESAGVDHTNAAVRVGSWSAQEQAYAAALIDGFRRGYLDLEQGTTLRVFLAERLCCSPMRVSKKLATGVVGNQTVPKRLGAATFHPALDISPVQVRQTERELARLREACFAPACNNDGESYVQSGRVSPRRSSPLSPINPSHKKRPFSETHQILPTLTDWQMCKKPWNSSMDQVEQC